MNAIIRLVASLMGIGITVMVMDKAASVMWEDEN